jgi:excisionase family DNA binding protein
MDEYITYGALAERVGVKVSTLYSMVSRREIPHVRLANRIVRFRVADIEAWLRERAVAPAVTKAPGSPVATPTAAAATSTTGVRTPVKRRSR